MHPFPSTQLEWLHANLCDRVTTQGLLGAVQKARGDG